MYHFQPRGKSSWRSLYEGALEKIIFGSLPSKDLRSVIQCAKFWKSRSTWRFPPMMYADPFYRITYLIKEEIRKYKWIEGEKGRPLSWPEARAE